MFALMNVADLPLVPAPPASSRRFATVAVLLALVVAAFEGTVVTTAMPTIARELGRPDLYPWVFAAFLLTSMVGVLVCGRLADTLGRKPVFVAGMGLFLLGSMACGLATSLPMLVAFRALQGLGAGAIQPIAMTIVSDIYALEERAKIQGIFTGTWGASSLVGPLLGGFLATHLSWRAVFLVNVPVGLLAAIVLAFSYRDLPREKRPLSLASAVLVGVAASLSLLALEPIGARGNASSALRLAALGIGLGLAAYVVYRERHTASPLFPRGLLPDPIVRVGYLGSLAGGALLYALTTYVPLWIESGPGGTPLQASLGLALLLAGWATGSTLGVRIFVRWGLRASAGGGFGLSFLCLVALTVCALGGHVLAAFPALFLMGVGMGPAVSTCLVGPQSRAPHEARGMITSGIYATRALGGAIAVAALAEGSTLITSWAVRMGVLAAVAFAVCVAVLTAKRAA